jgi:hypothetical protein
MGAKPYRYFVEYKVDLNGALQVKGTLIFANRR